MRFNPKERNKAIDYIDLLFEKNNKVDIMKVQKRKTLSQNAYLWLCFTHIGYQTGASKDDMYHHYLSQFPKYKEIEIFGKTEIVKVSLSNFTKQQTSQFINEVVIQSQIDGYPVPEPDNKEKISEMYNYYREIGMI